MTIEERLTRLEFEVADLRRDLKNSIPVLPTIETDGITIEDFGSTESMPGETQ